MIDKSTDSLFSSARLEYFFIWQETEDGVKSLHSDLIQHLYKQDVKPNYVKNGSPYLFKPYVLRANYMHLGGHIATYEWISGKSTCSSSGTDPKN